MFVWKEFMKKKIQSRTISPPSTLKGASEEIRLFDYEITYEPIEHESVKKLPAVIKKKIEELHHLIRKEPDQAIPVLRKLIQEYPDVPVFSNYLYIAYASKGDNKKAKEITLENYRRHPDYLFAKLGYAQLLLESGETEEFAEVFDNKFDLSLLYPNRKIFHVSEFVSFSGVIGAYYCEMGKLDSAEVLHNLLNKIVPDHPVTKMLEGKLKSAALMKTYENLTERKMKRKKPD
jgi:tetratricopeptide (TPR) repeat protein